MDSLTQHLAMTEGIRVHSEEESFSEIVFRYKFKGNIYICVQVQWIPKISSWKLRL